MIFEGQIHKMTVDYAKPIQYYLVLKNGYIHMNQQIGKKIRLFHDHNECLGCGLDKPIFRMGYCKNCFFTLPQANDSIIRPELSTAHLGLEQRNLEWEKSFELQPHTVYLAVAGGLKVGVTRSSQETTRWIDQGAAMSTVLARTENRYEAGMIEVSIAPHIGDKTNYQKMLKNEAYDVDFEAVKNACKDWVDEAFKSFLVDDNEIFNFHYPVEKYPTKIKSVNLSKNPEFEGVLSGIRGQYLIFETGEVLNVRSHEGYYLKIEIN